MNTVYLDKAKVPAHLRGGYSGNKFQAQVCESMTVPMDAGLWSGGTRSTFNMIRLSDGVGVPLPGQADAPWDATRRDRKVDITPGFAVVEERMFCGKVMGLRYFLNPVDAAPLLEAPAAELTAVEKLVLGYTSGRKSSYNGKDRYEMARDDARYDWSRPADIGMTPADFPSRADWEAAKQALIGRGLLNKAGAITPAGRNQAPRI